MALSFWDGIAAQLRGGPQGYAQATEQEALQQAQAREQDMSEQPHFANIIQNRANSYLPEAPLPEQPQAPDQQLQIQAMMAPGQQRNPYEKQYIDSLIGAQDLQREGISDLQKRIMGLQNAPQRDDSIQKMIISAADVWGGGGGKFGKMYDEANPELSKQQRQAAITQLEDTLRKSKGDLSDSQIAVLKAKMGFAESRMKANQKDGGTQLPAGQADRLAELGNIESQIAEIENDWTSKFGSKKLNQDDYSYMAGLKGYIPGSEENIYEDQRKLKAQTIGKALEGGKLTDVDYTKYMKFVPSAADTPKQAKAKIDNLRNFAKGSRDTLLQTLGQAGYRVGNIAGASSGGGLSPQQYARMQELLAKKAARTLQQ